MTSFARFAPVIAIALLAAAPAVAQSPALRLAQVASALGYTYAWLPGEAAVSLSRPGIVVVLRAGNTRYEIGDGVAIADRAPVFEHDDLVVSPSVAATLKRVAAEHPLPQPPASPPTFPAAASGTLTVDARMAFGMDAVAVRGRAPAGVPVTIALAGEISRDLPSVTIARRTVITAADGSYAALIGLTAASGPPGTAVIATVTSLPGITPASTRLIVAEPSPSVVSPLDTIPQ